MASLWNCSHCGTPNRGATCSKCRAFAPCADESFHNPASYWGIIHGYKGIYALPRVFALSLLVLFLGLYLFPLIFLWL